ncbi:pyridoxamine 5'-phosphate oxidase family protein [uncultured Aquimarina sp.]|uniref:pyridoxamine 5'-phosphate oxidase family protein n=1 Tax=uncultured Aquimarina sp. TaxID=575652 RepID=UPI00262D2E38|nr:pyridoxamine 5'-phosphate oxidase family protein [uncultured Aquimarina sp.]
MKKSHFHKGELEIQKKYNISHNPRLAERMLKDHIMDQLIPFIEQQSTIIVSTTDANTNIWASMLIGDKGFVKVKTSKQIDIHLDQLKSTQTEILFKNILAESKIGMLFIDTATRSRYRLNGYATLHSDKIEVTVSEAYPNCPKYIQQRIPVLSEEPSELGVEELKGTTLNNIHKQWIKNADTFFLGSMNANRDMDASHRGGATGFIEILDDGTLKIPDYVGNNLFNTLGNFVQVPKAGLLFIDFEKGHSLQLSGETELFFDQEGTNDLEKTMGTGRYWLFRTIQWIQTEFHNQIDWKLISFSPFNPEIK